MGWSLLHPIAMTAIICIVFKELFHQNIREFAPLLLAGLATWNYVLTVSLQGCQCFFQGESYIRQHPAPLAIYPLRTALGGAIHFLLALMVVLVLTWYCKGFGNPLALLSLAPAICLLFIFVWSLAVLAGFANVHFQDTQHLCEVGFQILFYATPIMYPEKMLREFHLDWLVDYNPLVPLLRLIREPILLGKVPSLETYGMAGLTVLIVACAACFTLTRLQKRLIFYL
jgi:ABC-type polysaccharide/polyol phosphate export permease